jgi:schlafen family protein
MTKILPTEGSTTLDLLAEAINAAPSLLGVDDTAELRSVLVPVSIGENRLIAFASVLRIGWPSELTEEIVREAGGIILVAARFTASKILNKQGLVETLNAWRPFGHYETSLDFHDNVNISRFTSFSDWSVEPIWTLHLSEKTTPSLSRVGRTGPFLHADSDFFAENIGDACRQWLLDPTISDVSSQGIYTVTMRDRRAWLKNLKIDHESGYLSVELERKTKSEVILTTITVELDGKKTVNSEEVRGSSFSSPIPLPLTDIRVYLTDRTGISYDDFRETTQYRERRRRSILYPPPALDPEYQELRDALVEGESETVEFKAWLPIDRAKAKSYELLKAATAFANTFGGAIYVGVTDDCEVVGTAQQLRTEFLNSTATDGEALRKEYADTLRRYLNQGISPEPASSVGWITHAGIPILRIGITSKGVLHSIVEDGAIYIRKGARDRKAAPSEIEAIVAKREPKKSGLFPLS